MDVLTQGLWYERTTASVSHVAVRRRSTGSVEPVLRLRRGAMNGRRVHVDLVLLGGDRTVEVSFHPAATVDLVRGEARRRGYDANGWLGALTAAVTDDAARWGSWTPAEVGSSPLAVLGGVTHPLLGTAYDAGVAAAGQIPRWASPALAEPSMAACAVRLFGAPAASRLAVRALAQLLVRPAVAWWQLAAAVAITSVCAADDLAAVLTAAGPAGAPPLPSSDDVAVLRAGLSLLEPARARRLVIDAATTAGEDGIRRLATALRTLVEVRDDVRWPPPVRLADLEGVCLRTVAVDPAPPSPPRPRPAMPRPAAPGWTTPRRAPATAGPEPGADVAFDHPPSARALEGRPAGDLDVVLPRTPQELRSWGRLLGNCLGDFGAAVAEHRSIVLGVRERGLLVAAVELAPDLGAVRQFLGPANRPAPPHVVDAVLGGLLPAASRR